MLETALDLRSRVMILSTFSQNNGGIHHWSIPHVASKDFSVSKGEGGYTVSCVTVDGPAQATIREVIKFTNEGAFVSGERTGINGVVSDEGALNQRDADKVLRQLLHIRSQGVVGSLAIDPFSSTTTAENSFSGMRTPLVKVPYQS